MSRTVGPYEVVRRLGRGGMGEVLLAYDPRLDRQVAIKRIRAGSEMDPSRRARFRREARLAASLQHPAIVQVFDLLTVGEVEHIVFEHVPGTSLRETLKSRGPLPVEEGSRVARDVAEGLEHAHRRGVIHRDLKSENVLLTPEGQAKIADFGIARRLLEGEGGTPLTREGKVLGTYRAMSPEQLQGGEVDHRSDLFSLGVLLYEIFTDRSPFLGASEAETLTRILHHRPPPPSEERRDLPPELSRLVLRLLEKDPLLRPRDTGEVVTHLRALERAVEEDRERTRVPESAIRSAARAGAGKEGSEPNPEPPKLPGSGGRNPGRWHSPGSGSGKRATASGAPRRRLLAGGALLLLAALATAWLLLRAPAPPRTVAVLEPTPRGELPPETADTIAFALHHGLIRTLASLQGISPLSPEEAGPLDDPPPQVARALAADEVVTATFTCEDVGCVVEIRRLRGEDGAVLWNARTEFPRNEPLVGAQAVTVALRRGYPDHPVRAGTRGITTSAEDYAAYSEIRRNLGVAGETADLEALMARLEALRRRSPDFVDAYLLEARLAVRWFHTARDPELLDRAFDLLARARDLSPRDPAVLFQRFAVEIAAGELERAEDTLAELERLLPGDVRILDRRAHLLEERGRLGEALELLRRGAERRPSWRRLFNHGRMAMRLGQMEPARTSLRRLLELSPGNRQGLALLARLEMRQGRFAVAADLFEHLVAQAPRPSDLSNLAVCQLSLGRLEEAAESLERALASTPDHPQMLLNLADVRLLQGRTAAARELYRRVVERVEEDPTGGGWQFQSVRAQALAHLGRHSEAVEAVQEVLAAAPEDGWAAFEAALVYALAGEQHSALASARRALGAGIEPPWFEMPWFDPLRRNPLFRQALKAPTAPPEGRR